jgi:hypothetical protein
MMGISEGVNPPVADLVCINEPLSDDNLDKCDGGCLNKYVALIAIVVGFMNKNQLKLNIIPVNDMVYCSIFDVIRFQLQRVHATNA